MKFIGFDILKEIVEKRELTLGDVSKLLPKKFNDHRDFYALASLYTGGYIDCTMVREKANWDINKNNLVAELFYTMTFGKGTFKYKDMLFTNDEDFNEEKMFCTAKGDMYFDEQRRKKVNGQTMTNVNINVTQVVSFIGEFSKKYPIGAALSAIVLVIGLFWTIIQMYDYFANLIYSDQIYLSLWETDKKIPINDYTFQIPPLSTIKPNEVVTLRFILTQNNTNAPQITSILLTFPDDAKVTPMPYNGWSWMRNNDVANRYFLNFTTSQIPANGEDYNLPALNVVFQNIGLLPFSYQIVGNKIKPIRRDFAINTALKCDEWLTKGQHYPMGEANVPIVSGNNYNTATSQTVLMRSIDMSTITPDAKVITEQKTK